MKQAYCLIWGPIIRDAWSVVPFGEYRCKKGDRSWSTHEQAFATFLATVTLTLSRHWPDIDPTTYIHELDTITSRYNGCVKIKFLRQGFRKSPSDRRTYVQTRLKLYTTPLCGWSKLKSSCLLCARLEEKAVLKTENSLYAKMLISMDNFCRVQNEWRPTRCLVHLTSTHSANTGSRFPRWNPSRIRYSQDCYSMLTCTDECCLQGFADRWRSLCSAFQ